MLRVLRTCTWIVLRAIRRPKKSSGPERRPCTRRPAFTLPTAPAEKRHSDHAADSGGRRRQRARRFACTLTKALVGQSNLLVTFRGSPINRQRRSRGEIPAGPPGSYSLSDVGHTTFHALSLGTASPLREAESCRGPRGPPRITINLSEGRVGRLLMCRVRVWKRDSRAALREAPLFGGREDCYEYACHFQRSLGFAARSVQNGSCCSRPRVCVPFVPLWSAQAPSGRSCRCTCRPYVSAAAGHRGCGAHRPEGQAMAASLWFSCMSLATAKPSSSTSQTAR